MTSDRTGAPFEILGAPVENWKGCPVPPRQVLQGRYCQLEPLDPTKHGEALFDAFRATDPASWAYLPFESFTGENDFRHWLADCAARNDFIYYAVIDGRTGHASGVAAYMRIDPPNGVIEVGAIHYADSLKRTRATTEVMFLMMRHVFDDLGYRRYEWKCNSFNQPSRTTALRLGFRFEGIFRQHMVVKGRNRDTAWFAILDSEWPALKTAYEQWLAPANFDADGQQIRSLAALIAAERGS